ncbi:MAG: GGDEF domain-containing protein [Gammaproteobacteria bacterium]|nr:GGDEF domain-containing protein [Gammaproteobacteria bacterium]
MHPTIPGLGRWALAGGAGALALVLILFYGIQYWSPLLSLAQLIVVIGLVLAWDGFRYFIGTPPLSRLALVVITAILLTWVVATQLQDSIQLRVLGNAIIVAALSALIARELLTAPKQISAAMRATGWVYGINAVVFLIRIFATDLSAQPTGPLNPNGFAAFMLLWWLCMTIAVTLGMVLMTAERLQADLDKQANRDPLTGVLNRRSFSLMAEKALVQSRRYDKPLSILMMDLDRFKQINDRLGHSAGDILLCRFAAIAGQVLRGEDVFCRFGGEEFVALLPNASAELAQVAAERLRTTFAADSAKTETLENDLPLSPTVSIGIAELEQDEDIETLIRRADKALYQAKKKGRNCCHLAEGIEKSPKKTKKQYLSVP